jgi:hypothetical protein
VQCGGEKADCFSAARDVGDGTSRHLAAAPQIGRFWSNNGHRANGHYRFAAFRLEKLGQRVGRKLILDSA